MVLLSKYLTYITLLLSNKNIIGSCFSRSLRSARKTVRRTYFCISTTACGPLYTRFLDVQYSLGVVVLKQLYPNTGILNKTMAILNSLINNIFKCIVTNSKSHYNIAMMLPRANFFAQFILYFQKKCKMLKGERTRRGVYDKLESYVSVLHILSPMQKRGIKSLHSIIFFFYHASGLQLLGYCPPFLIIIYCVQSLIYLVQLVSAH